MKNSWQLIVSLGNDPLTSKRVQKTRHFKGTKAEAKRALSQFIREIEYGLKVDSDKITFGRYSEQWIADRITSGNLAPATILRDKQLLKKLNNYLENIQLKDIDAPTVRTLYALLADDGLGQASMIKAAIVLKLIFKQAVADDILIRNPCDSVPSPKQKKSNVSRALDKKGVAKLIKKLEEIENKEYPNAKENQRQKVSNRAHTMAVRIILSTGMRKSEVLGLAWSDIDFDNSILSVRYTLDRITGKLKEPKTESGIRDISLDNDILGNLRKWKLMQKDYLDYLGVEQSAGAPVITSESGTRINSSNLARWWRQFCDSNGFEGLRLHDLRHTSATLLVSSGLNIKAISARLGHSSVGITLDLYAHAQREDDEKAAAIIGNILSGQPEEQSISSNVIALQDNATGRKAN